MRIIYMGTPEFAVPCLDVLIDKGYEVCAVVTQPDKPKGRGKKICKPPVKEKAESYGISVLQPERLKNNDDFYNKLKEYNPDLIVTCAYGKILPKNILNIPPLGSINVHASLLPKYRGSAPIQWALINGEKSTGITTIFMDENMDTGDMLVKREIEIEENMIFAELHDKLSDLGAKVLEETLLKLTNGELEREPQDHNKATYAPPIIKEMGNINWNDSSQKIYNLYRGLTPYPGIYTFYDGCRMRIKKMIVADFDELDVSKNMKQGTVIKCSKEGLYVLCGEGVIKIIELQFDNCKTLTVEQYLCGHCIMTGAVLGE